MNRCVAAAASLLLMVAYPAVAAALFGFTVIDLAAGDVLNVRSGPGTKHQIQTAYAEGDNLSLTGRCTGGLRLDDIGHLERPQRYARLKTRWCEVWHDPSGNGAFTTGWVYGRYIYPH